MIYNLLYKLCIFLFPKANGIVITNNYRIILFKYWTVSWLSDTNNKNVTLYLVWLNNKIKLISYDDIRFIKYKEWKLYFSQPFTLFL